MQESLCARIFISTILYLFGSMHCRRLTQVGAPLWNFCRNDARHPRGGYTALLSARAFYGKVNAL